VAASACSTESRNSFPLGNPAVLSALTAATRELTRASTNLHMGRSSTSPFIPSEAAIRASLEMSSTKRPWSAALIHRSIWRGYSPISPALKVTLVISARRGPTSIEPDPSVISRPCSWCTCRYGSRIDPGISTATLILPPDPSSFDVFPRSSSQISRHEEFRRLGPEVDFQTQLNLFQVVP